MSRVPLLTVVIVLLMAKRLADIYVVGGHYVCPSCGPRSERRHSRDCPWSSPPSQ
jgi:hypothetical protein